MAYRGNERNMHMQTHRTNGLSGGSGALVIGCIPFFRRFSCVCVPAAMAHTVLPVRRTLVVSRRSGRTRGTTLTGPIGAVCGPIHTLARHRVLGAAPSAPSSRSGSTFARR